MQSKTLAIILFVISLIALTAAVTLFFQAKRISKDAAPQLLKELSGVMRKPGAIIDDVNDFLVQKFGPCWGIPEDQCRE